MVKPPFLLRKGVAVNNNLCSQGDKLLNGPVKRSFTKSLTIHFWLRKEIRSFLTKIS